jgi:hypothetical protein
LREEHRLEIFENGVLRMIFEPKGEEIAGHCKKSHSE